MIIRTTTAAIGVAAVFLCMPTLAMADDIVSVAGRTMGTTYSVKVFRPSLSRDEIAMAVDAELRSVNAEMSTYLADSEIRRFNESESTEWFDVSPGFAEVVARSIEISAATEGAFDVTIGPLIDLWGFGSRERSGRPPSSEAIASARQAIGWNHLDARIDPPAIRKAIPQLRIDLSSIAKGHGVDRVRDRLLDAGEANVFVEVGGEVAIAGGKDGVPWKVGIQAPDVAGQSLAATIALNDADGWSAMATSGDYRNYFEADGQRFSHTIDPRGGRPVRHDLASVTVLAGDCMTADAWATALSVLGGDEGIRVAEREGLATYMIRRDGESFRVDSSGGVADHVNRLPTFPATLVSARAEASTVPVTAQTQSGLVPVFVLTAILLGLLVTAMAVGVMFGRRSISGSCGGIAGKENEDGELQCSLCSNPAEGCRELREKMRQLEGERVSASQN